MFGRSSSGGARRAEQTSVVEEIALDKALYRVGMVLPIRGAAAGAPPLAEVAVDQLAAMGVLDASTVAFTNAGTDAGEPLAMIVGSLLAP